MEILITGSAGHLGEAIARSLPASGHEAFGIDLSPSRFTHRCGSIIERDFVADCLSGMDAVIHTASLHKPHVATHSRQDFIDTNITGTLNLLEAAHRADIKRFIFTSTTSAFGAALTPDADSPAAWITETVQPKPKNIYGATKTAAEDLCLLFHRNHGLACLVLRTSRFFPEEDDSKAMREAFADENAKANEFLFRRVDLEDAVAAHLRALECAPDIGFERYIISATTPFSQSDLGRLRDDAPSVVKQICPHFEAAYQKRDWRMFDGLDRVYVNEKARTELGWQPKYDFHRIVEQLTAGHPIGSQLARSVGVKGYHGERFADGLYPVD